jgi:hypothetical protein
MAIELEGDKDQRRFPGLRPDEPQPPCEHRDCRGGRWRGGALLGLGQMDTRRCGNLRLDIRVGRSGIFRAPPKDGNLIEPFGRQSGHSGTKSPGGLP